MEHNILKHWNSCPNELRLPRVPPSEIKRLHIYDFDNTLYRSPCPNRILYTNQAYLKMMNNESMNAGSWWDQSLFLEESFKMCIATQDKSYWDTKITQLAIDSFDDPNTVSIILTGRSESKFKELFQKMLRISRDLASVEGSKFYNQSNSYLKFNAVCLKARNPNSNMIPATFQFKCHLIKELVQDYPNLEDVTIYDDRIYHIKQFKSFFCNLRPRPKFQWFVVHVNSEDITLDRVAELKLMKRVIDNKNLIRLSRKLEPLEIRWTPKCTGFFLDLRSQRALLKTAFFVTRSFNFSKIVNLAEYPMYIPVCSPGNTMSVNRLTEIFGNGINTATAAVDFKDRYFDQRNPKNRFHVEFLVTHFTYTVVPHAHDRQGIIYFKVRPKNKLPRIPTHFRRDAPLIISGHVTDEETDKYLKYELTNSYLTSNNMIWRPLPHGISIQTTFGYYSKMRF
ncbi:hypothetical protein C6P45_001191 [Maudiozyma exigua]|uniref:Swiss Army Knife RNA repair protein HAD domain-containing protein n=1 Tax=Maudiozyma exigua TaxID=34358 RepID=A0A9P6WFJ8_MAUEX|nr:hypothetical protein C6P45_001191 [Kazachstania exigua]